MLVDENMVNESRVSEMERIGPFGLRGGDQVRFTCKVEGENGMSMSLRGARSVGADCWV